VALHRDDRETLQANITDVEHIKPCDAGTHTLVELQLIAWARGAERDRRPAEALTRLLTVLDPAGTLEFLRVSGLSIPWLADVVRLAMTLGDANIADAAATAAAREADGRPTPWAKAGAQHCHGLLESDPSAVLAAAGIYETAGGPLFRAMALEDAAVLYAERGELDSARAIHLEAFTVYRDLDAAWDMMRSDARLRAHKIRRGTRGARCRGAVGWDALTETEQKIAQLIAVGRSNPDIAHHMLVSRNTVESHVSHILRKLNARSRVEIARAARG
jgi:DNA-binding CsgD family transcriptional regulator